MVQVIEALQLIWNEKFKEIPNMLSVAIVRTSIINLLYK